jgi:hypothetical protein
MGVNLMVFVVNWVHPIYVPSFLFPEDLHCCYVLFHCSMYSYYNYSNLYIKCWVSAFHTQIQNFLTLWMPLEESGLEVKGGPKTGWRQSDFKDIFNVFQQFSQFV